MVGVAIDTIKNLNSTFYHVNSLRLGDASGDINELILTGSADGLSPFIYLPNHS